MNHTIVSSTQRNISIDLIKVLAMTFVMMLHTIPPYHNNLPCFILATISGIAIPLFFMVSGYLLINKKGGWKYSIHKIIGIIKFVTILTIPITILRRLLKPDYWFDLKSWIVDLIGPYFQLSYLWVLWYLGAMCIIYLILPIIHNLYRRYNLIFLIISTLFFAVICNTVFTLNTTIHFERGIYQTLRAYNLILYFLMGATTKILMPQIKNAFSSFVSKKQWQWILTPIIFALIYSCFLRYISHKDGVEYQFGSAMCMAYSIVTFVCISLYKPGKFVTKWVKILSNLFLPAFVIHTFVISALTKVMPQTAPDNYIGIFKFLIVWIVTISISYIIMKTSIGRWVFRI